MNALVTETDDRADLLGYSGSIVKSAIEPALAEQVTELWGVQAILESMRDSLKEREEEGELALDAPTYWIGVDLLARTVKKIAEDLEAPVLEERAVEMAEERRHERKMSGADDGDAS
jgi:hypothetical protein